MNTTARTRLLLIFIVLWQVTLTAQAQSPKGMVGSWWMVFNQTRLTNRISLHSEFQYRSYNVGTNLQQLLPRVGVNYHLNKTSFVTAGYAWIPNYAYDKDLASGTVQTENRVWEQYQVRTPLGKVALDHRFRLEQRWAKANNSAVKYSDRFRYFVRATLPVTTPVAGGKYWFLTAYEEIFLHFKDQPFDRNRLYGAVGYQFTPLVNLQTGYMWQTVGSVTKPYVQAALFYNVDLRPKK